MTASTASDISCRVNPVEYVAGLRAYRVPTAPAVIDLPLSANEGPPPASEVLKAMAGVDPETLRRYPSASPLEATLARRFGVTPEQVIVTSGGDDALDRCCRAVLGPGRDLILPVPTFEMIERSARLTGADVAQVAWPAGAFPTEAVIARINRRTAAISIVTPNNPTGAIATADDLRRIATAAPTALLIVDLAYGEFAEVDLMPVVLELDNAIAMRTFSKAFGLAGLRVGCAVGPEMIINWLRAVGSPYPVAGPSLAVAQARLGVGNPADSTYVRAVQGERVRLVALLDDLGAKALPSQANFVLARFPDATFVFNQLAQRGIGVRAFPGDAVLNDSLRITCPGDEALFSRLTNALAEILTSSTDQGVSS